MKKDLTYVCNYKKALVIPSMPDNFIIAEPFRHGFTNEELRKGITAFRDFLYSFYDFLSANKYKIDVETGKKYDPNGSTNDSGNGNINNCFPIFCDIPHILVALGFHGRFVKGSELKLRIHSVDLLTVICSKSHKYMSLANKSSERLNEMFCLLSELGLCFTGLDISNKINFSKTGTFHITFRKNDYFIIGLKLIAEATVNNKYHYYLVNMLPPAFLRCDFYPLANELPKKHKIKIREFVNPQQSEVKEWILNLDSFLMNNGCTITHTLDGDQFSYLKRKIKNYKGLVCKIYFDIRGCFITPGINHMKNPINIISMLPDDIIELIKNERKCGHCTYSRRNPNLIQCREGCPFKFTHKGVEYIRCRYGEFKISLSNEKNRKLIWKWLEMELAC
jgi:hypothetical protein